VQKVRWDNRGTVRAEDYNFFYGKRKEFWLGNLMERDHLGDPGVDRRIILRWIFMKWDVGVCTGLSWLRIGTGVGYLSMQ
jgi:hypothetical protein